MNFLTINGRLISFEDIKHRTYEANSPYERNTLDFCSDWLEGKKNFFHIETSGSTGSPKTITIERDKMALSAHLTCRTLDLQQNSNVLVCINTKYIGGLMMLVRCFENTMNPIIINPSSDLLSSIKNNNIRFAAFVPLQIKKLLEYSAPGVEALASIENVIIGGAPLNRDQETILADLPNNIYQTFGMTETFSHIALKRLKDKNNLYVGLHGVTFSTNDSGCLIVESPLHPIPLITNDLVRLKSKNQFKWVGRTDNVINSGGIKVSPEIIESTVGKIMQEVGINSNFFVYGIKDENLGEAITLGLEGSKLPRKIEEDLLWKIRNDCLQYSFPKSITYTSEFAYTSTGKIDRIKTKKLF